jgi:hypothetical protein
MVKIRLGKYSSKFLAAADTIFHFTFGTLVAHVWHARFQILGKPWKYFVAGHFKLSVESMKKND